MENETVQSSRRIIKSLKAKADAKRTFSEKIADFLTSLFGSIAFLLIHVIWFAFWLVVNLDLILLTMIVSLEAIFLSIFVLISQNRASKIDDLREEIDLQVDIITEQELTKLMAMVNVLLKKQGIDTSKDEELQQMLKPTNMEKIERTLEKQVVD